MTAVRLLGIVLIVAGALGLAYGGFSYTQERTAAKIGPIELKLAQTETVDVPLWAGIAAIVGGGVLLIGAARKP